MTEGLLQDIHLNEIIQLLSFIDRKTGDLELTPLLPFAMASATVPVGHIYFLDGKIHAAFLKERFGESAIENFFLWDAGKFVFRPLQSYELPRQNIQTDENQLIFRGIERWEKWKVSREIAPILRIALQKVQPNLLSPPLEQNSPEMQIYHFCDGKTLMYDLIHPLQIGGLRLREAIAFLIANGYATITPMNLTQKLVCIIVTTAYPMLGASAELFCDDALRAVKISPELILRPVPLTAPVIIQIIREIEEQSALVIGPQRAAITAKKIAAALEIEYTPRSV